jgi:hypothetical protein
MASLYDCVCVVRYNSQRVIVKGPLQGFSHKSLRRSQRIHYTSAARIRVFKNSAGIKALMLVWYITVMFCSSTN